VASTQVSASSFLDCGSNVTLLFIFIVGRHAERHFYHAIAHLESSNAAYPATTAYRIPHGGQKQRSCHYRSREGHWGYNFLDNRPQRTTTLTELRISAVNICHIARASLPYRERTSLNIEQKRAALRWPLAVIFFSVGIIHLHWTSVFLPIMPGWVPYPRDIILFTGGCELAGSVGLITRRFRYLAGVMLALYAVCVFPANIKHAFSNIPVGGVHLSWWYHGPRLAFQPVIVWWALFASGVVNWPFGKPGQGN